MNEADWAAAATPGLLLQFLGRQADERRLRLFGCGCCRQAWHLLRHEASRAAVACAERYADGLVDAATLGAARRAALAHCHFGGGASYAAAECALTTGDTLFQALAAAAYIAKAAAKPRPKGPAAAGRSELPQSPAEARRAVGVAQAMLVRCLFGNPFRPVMFEPAWRTATVAALAQGIYADHAFDRLPILADALEEAGCTAPAVLDHCRTPGPHARGCWVVDLARAQP